MSSPSSLGANSQISNIDFGGYDSSVYYVSAYIQATTTEQWGAFNGKHGTQLTLSTYGNNNGGPNTYTFDQDGSLTIPGSLAIGGTLGVTGTSTLAAVNSGAITSSGLLGVTVSSGYAATFMGGNVGIGTTTPRKLADFLSTSQSQLRLSYTDNSVFTDFTTDASGNLTIAPSGGNATFAGTINIDSLYINQASSSHFPMSWRSGGVIGHLVSYGTSEGISDDNTSALEEVLMSPTSKSIIFQTKGATAVTIDSSKNMSVVGAITTINNLTNEGSGVVATPDTISWTGQTASISSKNFSNTATGHLYRFTYYVSTTTTSTSGGTISISTAWNDGSSQTFTSGTALLSATGVTGMIGGTEEMYVASGVPTWSTTVSGVIVGSPQYQIRACLERIW